MPGILSTIYLLYLAFSKDSGLIKIKNTSSSVFEEATRFGTHKFIRPYFFRGKQRLLSEKEHEWLEEKLPYYYNLDVRAQKLFGGRILNFLEEIEIKGREHFEVSREMKLLIAAVAVQLTFGFRKYYLKMFKRIYVFPTAYYNRFTKQYHKGETSPLGVVVLSWDSFKKGIEIEDDNLNLGIHEFAHALVLQRRQSPRFSDPIFTHWVDRLSKQLENPRLFSAISKHPYFRKYAQTNEMEFFAVATEAFFETPQEFKSSLPKLYHLMCKMYNQNPANFS